MQLPHELSIHRPFNLEDIREWVNRAHPTQIEMTDKQYAWFCDLSGMNLKTFEGIPIVFVGPEISGMMGV